MKCKHCGSDRIVSSGSNARCKDCGRHSKKIRRQDTIPLEERPYCPECGASEPYSHGRKSGVRLYVCRECGRVFSDRYEKVETNELPTLEVQIE